MSSVLSLLASNATSQGRDKSNVYIYITPLPCLQIRCLNEIENDMIWRKVPMDRLLCGDVGFGKTEVALRAMFR